MRTRRQNIQLARPAAKGEARAPTPKTSPHGAEQRPETPSNRRVRTRTHGGVGGEEPRGSPLSRLRYGPAGDSAPRLRLKATGMAERFPFGPSTARSNLTTRPAPPFPLVSSASFGSARSRPGREAAKRTLDGEDRSATMKCEGKGVGAPQTDCTKERFHNTPGAPTGFQGFRRCETVLQERFDWR